MVRPAARYREFAPCESLRAHVRAYFTFQAPAEDGPPDRPAAREVLFHEGDSSWSATFADGHVSLVFSIGEGYRVDGLWDPGPRGPRGHVLGAMSAVRASRRGTRMIEVGAFFRAARNRPFLHAPAGELTDRIVAIEDLWGGTGRELEAQLGEARGDAQRIAILETALLRKMEARRNGTSSLDVAGLAALALQRGGLVSVDGLAEAAGISRQHLTRVFREDVGVTPKLYCRLARFHAALAYVGRGRGLDWAEIAAEAGYADQSHMIAEFREFSGRTPGAFLRERTFHPFFDRSG